jgi:hypothetical protein
MEIVFEGALLFVSTDGSIQTNVNREWQKEQGIVDVDGSLKLCIHNRYYKFQDIIAHAFMDYDPKDKNRIVTHMNGIKTDNRIDNLCIENISIKRKFERMSIE